MRCRHACPCCRPCVHVIYVYRTWALTLLMGNGGKCWRDTRPTLDDQLAVVVKPQSHRNRAGTPPKVCTSGGMRAASASVRYGNKLVIGVLARVVGYQIPGAPQCGQVTRNGMECNTASLPCGECSTSRRPHRRRQKHIADPPSSRPDLDCIHVISDKVGEHGRCRYRSFRGKRRAEPASSTVAAVAAVQMSGHRHDSLVTHTSSMPELCSLTPTIVFSIPRFNSALWDMDIATAYLAQDAA